MSFALPAVGLYRGRVCAVAITGLGGVATYNESCAHSRPTLYDSTPPTAGKVCVRQGTPDGPVEQCAGGMDASGPMVLYAAKETNIQLAWRSFGDAESGVRHFHLLLESSLEAGRVIEQSGSGVGLLEGARDMGASKWMGLATSAIIDALNTTTRVTVICTNGAGLTVNTSIELVADRTPPVIEYSVWGPDAIWGEMPPTTCRGPIRRYVHTARPLVRWWRTAVVDAESGLREVTLKRKDWSGSSITSFDLSDATAGNASLVFEAELGQPYSIVLTAFNVVGLSTSSCPLILIADPAPPGNGVLHLCDAHGKRLYELLGGTVALTLCTERFEHPASFIARLDVQVMLDDAESTWHLLRLPFPKQRRLWSHQLPLLLPEPLPCVTSATFRTTAVSGASVSAPPQSITLPVDCTPPVGGHAALSVGSEDDVATCVQESWDIRLLWDQFAEPESRIAHYQFAMSSAASLPPPRASDGLLHGLQLPGLGW